ncbi:MAG: ABC transporter ATP-binding protein [Clostridia bacterium]|nr:ABC transporter ATP-binding protein [Clostridia bacterium]
MKFFKTIISSLKNTKLLIAIFFILSILVNYLTTCVPVVIQYFIDYILKQENLRNGVLDWIVNFYENKIGFIAVICVVVSIIQLAIIVFTYIRNITKTKIIQEFQAELKLKLFNHIQNLTYQDFYNNSLADLVQNSSDDVNNIVNFIDKQLTFILDVILIIVFAISQLITIDFRLSSILLILSFLIIFLSVRYCKNSKHIIQKRIEMQRKLYSKMNDNFNNLKFIKLNNLQEQEQEEFGKIVEESNKFHKAKVKMDANYDLTVEHIVKLGPPLIFVLSGYLYSLGSISIGSIYVTLSYSNKVTKSFIDIADILEALNLFRESYKRLDNLLELTLEDDEKKICNIEIKDKTVVFENANIIVNGKVILENLNFNINENEKVLVVGSTGSGKSILLKTLIGFYEYTGSIKIGGIEVRELNKKLIRENICLLLQDSYLFSRTIADNIRILVPYMPYDQMINISKFCALDDDIKKLKAGYYTKIGKKGIALSKGQRQRLVLARAFTKPKSIMIFDDSFSAIDRSNKKQILDNLMSLEDNFTKIIITHDIDLAPNFDKVIYLNNKTVIVGHHEELMEEENYRKVYKLNQDKLEEEYI